MCCMFVCDYTENIPFSVMHFSKSEHILIVNYEM